MARLPQPGGDSGNWGEILNEYLSQSHKGDGTLKDNIVTSNALAPNSITNTALASNSVNAAVIADESISKIKLASTVQTSLDRADTSTQPADLAAKYTKPSGGIPLSDIKKADLDQIYAPANSALTSTEYAKVKLVLNTAVLGDSIDADTTGWWPTACALTQQRMRFAYNGGVGGNTTTQVLARIAEITARQPQVCVIGGGVTNDIGQGIDLTTTTRSNLQNIASTLKASGITPVLRGCPPRGAGIAPYETDAKAIAAIASHNTWARSYAAAQGIDFFDIWNAAADTTTNLYKSGYSDDGIHPNTTGVLAIARAFRDANLATFSNAAEFDLITSTFGNSPADGLFLADSNSDGVSDAWSSSAWTTNDITTPAPVGRWQHFAGAASSTWYLAQKTLTVSPGQPIDLGFRLSVTSGSAWICIRFYQADNTTAVGSWQALQVKALATTSDSGTWIMRTVVPAQAFILRLYVQNQDQSAGTPVPAPAEYRIAQLTLRRRE